MLTKLNAILLIVAISSLLFVGYTYMNTYSTTVRWQARAITNYNAEKKVWDAEAPSRVALNKVSAPKDATEKGPKKEAWWHENPIFVAAKAWAELGGNMLAIVICTSSLLGRAWIRAKRKVRETFKRPHSPTE